jgi:hypothetical protein
MKRNRSRERKADRDAGTEAVSVELRYPFATYRQELELEDARLEIKLSPTDDTASLCLYGRRRSRLPQDAKRPDIDCVATIRVPGRLIQDMLNGYFDSLRRMETMRIAVHEGKLGDLLKGQWKPRTIMRKIKG